MMTKSNDGKQPPQDLGQIRQYIEQLKREEKYSVALKVGLQALGEHANDPFLLAQIGDIYQHNGSAMLAASILSQALKNCPSDQNTELQFYILNARAQA